ncbi:hypothetical protein L2E82_25031 [Cichorium intybus]|uniref:Uncharacterized protein n=1 Tax=Cichorium intybus TaxID=13427 RepID=A0ACB9E343_CICIN|nr:hypothetical protein L2E82_25031 [Cichorium intybus]
MIIILCLLLFVHPSSANLTFNFTSFNPNNHELNYQGDAAPSNTVIQLTRNQQDKEMHWSSGRVTYQKLFHLWDKDSGELADFTTRFSFTINSGDQPIYGDGIAFFLAPEGFELPPVQEGSGIGLVGGDQVVNSTLNPFIAVEFDTYKNDWDPVGDHVGININSMVSVENVTWSSLVHNGQKNIARVSYNSSAKRLSVAFTGFDQTGVIFTQRLGKVVDLKRYLPEYVSIGFSASTGDYFEIHTLHSWEFNSSLPIYEERIDPIVSEISMNSSAPSPSVFLRPVPKSKGQSKVVLGIGLGLGLSVSGLIIGFFMFGTLKKRRIIFQKKDEDEFGAPLPNLPKALPTVMFSATPITMSAFWGSPLADLTGSGRDYTMCSSSSEDAKSSKHTSSSSASSIASFVGDTE